MDDLINDTLDDFLDVINDKRIQLQVNFTDIKMVKMDRYLAETMVANLLRNAIIHNDRGGSICIELSDQALTMTNSGNKLGFPEEDIFKRFSRSEYNKQSLGIGLSIVKRICDLYDFDVNYQFSGKHIFSVDFR